MSQERYTVSATQAATDERIFAGHERVPLGSADFEHERLMRQAVWVAPHTRALLSQRGGSGPGSGCWSWARGWERRA